ncbi:4-alpha-glucanotransferase [Desulfosediminicola sp.]|uniref:4-alpha-glucanotransferase n=1 Tax=Desulfosediminicola sp. TaxID=2886825 RepID=UPI003AF2FC58
MPNLLSQRRRSGILAHISSLPSPYGIGDIGHSSHRFLEFLAKSGQSCWQFLPFNPTNPLFDNSPYMSVAAFAGSPLLISPDLLKQSGLVSAKSLDHNYDFSPFQADYTASWNFKKHLLAEAFTNFEVESNMAFQLFCDRHRWLEDYALFMVLKEQHTNRGWFQWPRMLAARDKSALKKHYLKHKERILYYKFEQFIFTEQWKQLRSLATDLDILLFGDIPIYVGLDSVDVWANQDIYDLDPDTFLPNKVSGVPPDYFSETGQRWGNPLYNWSSESVEIRKQLEDWWVDRFSNVFEFVDIARIDHFRAFESYWAIPAENDTAVDGDWVKGPGAGFFKKIKRRLGELNIIAEDLGIITQEVIDLRDKLELPGMKVLQFAFDGNPDNSFLPYNYNTSNCVVYTGTHDNETTVGWFLNHQLNDDLRKTIKELANRTLHDDSGIHNDLMYLALSSIGCLTIFPLQDALGFGNDCRMNSPGVPEGNWGWRCIDEYLSEELSTSLRARTKLFGRYSESKPKSEIQAEMAKK